MTIYLRYSTRFGWGEKRQPQDALQRKLMTSGCTKTGDSSVPEAGGQGLRIAPAPRNNPWEACEVRKAMLRLEESVVPIIDK